MGGSTMTRGLRRPSGPSARPWIIRRARMTMNAVDNPGPGQWLVEDGISHSDRIGLHVPRRFTSVVRVLHTVARASETLPRLRWEEVAGTLGTELTATTTWADLTEAYRARPAIEQSGDWQIDLDLGCLPREQAEVLASFLGAHTVPQSECWFAVWEGWARLRHEFLSAPLIDYPDRPMRLLTGEVGDAAVNLASTANDPYLSANCWWPDDRAWCVVTDVDGDSTYVGGSPELTSRLLASDLETLCVTSG
jgi:hypothetical protein